MNLVPTSTGAAQALGLVILETPFVGPGMRDAGERLDYLPMRLSLVPRLFSTIRPPDAVLLHTSTARKRKLSLGIEVEEDLASPTLGPSHEHAERIAELAASLVEDGSTLQLGIGQVPDATLRALGGSATSRSGRR